MTSCGRGCCFTGLSVCARAYQCLCHASDRKPTKEKGSGRRHRDPTAAEAIRNVMKARKK